MKKLFLIISGFLIGLFLFYFLTINPINTFNSEKEITISDEIEKEYNLIQKYDLDSESSARPIPTVTEKPDKDKYKIFSFNEYVNSFGSSDQLFFASKRIAELQKWGKELDWKKSLDQYKNHVTAYWKGINKNEEQKKYPEFIASLQTHYRILEELIFLQSDNQVKNIQKMQYVDQVFDQFHQLIPNYTITSPNNLYFPIYDIVNDKEYGIYNMHSQINNNYNYLQDIRLSTKDNTYYPQIVDSEDHETKQIIFNGVFIDHSNSLSSVISINLPEIKNKILKWTKSINKAAPNSYIYKTLINNLDPGEYAVNIAYAFKNPASIDIEEQIATTESKLKYRMDPLYQQTIYPHGYSHTFSKPFQKNTSNEKVLGTYLNVESLKELTTDEINSISISFTPVIHMELTADKVSALLDIKPIVYYKKISNAEYKITTINLSKNQDQKILESLGFGWGWNVVNQSQNKNQSEYIALYWVNYAIGFITVFLIIFVTSIIFYTNQLYQVMLYYLKSYWKKTAVYPIQNLWRVFQYICRYIRLILLLLVTLGFLIDIFIIQGNSDILILLLTGLWVLVLIGYNAEAKINFVLAFIFLLFCPVLTILKLDPIAEKSAVWVYVMLIVGTFQLLIETRFETKGLTEYPRFLKKVTGYSAIRSIGMFMIKLLLKFLGFIKKTVISSVSFCTLGIISVFGYLFDMLKRIIYKRPRSVKDFSIIIIKIFVTLSFFVMFTAFIFILPFIIGFTSTKITIILKNQAVRYQKKLEEENLKKERKKLDPVIEIIEPKLVYKATRVVIYGKKFGWDVKKSQALIDGKKIDAVLWTDSKIIFPVPLHWKIGTHKIWIEKQVNWNGKKEIGKSNAFEIKILPITEKLTEDDRLYFEQLKNLRKETLELNGYN